MGSRSGVAALIVSSVCLLGAVSLPIFLASGCAKGSTTSTNSPPSQTTATSTTTMVASTVSMSSSPQTNNVGDQGGKEAVLTFLSALASSDYATAASLYGGDLDGPGSTRAERMKSMVYLLKVFAPRYVRTEYTGFLQTVWVQLIQPDGTPYWHVPPQDAPGKPTDEFAFYVVRTNGRWWVMSLPPYQE